PAASHCSYLDVRHSAARARQLRRGDGMNGLQRVLVPAGILAGATAAALLIAEGVLRLAHLAPTEGLATVNAGEFAAIPGIFAPRQDLIDRRDPHLPYHVTTNSLGYRGSDVPQSKPP